MEISDRAFHPPVLLIETGDRVWWFWDKFKVTVCRKREVFHACHLLLQYSFNINNFSCLYVTHKSLLLFPFPYSLFFIPFSLCLSVFVSLSLVCLDKKYMTCICPLVPVIEYPFSCSVRNTTVCTRLRHQP